MKHESGNSEQLDAFNFQRINLSTQVQWKKTTSTHLIVKKIAHRSSDISLDMDKKGVVCSIG